MRPHTARARGRRGAARLALAIIYTHLAAPAQADEGGGGWRHAHLLAARANPPGLVSDSAVGYERGLRDLYGADAGHPLLGPTRALLGANALLSPQSAQLGPLLRATPLTVLELQLSALYVLPITDVRRARRSRLSDAATLAAVTPAAGGADAVLTRGWRLSAQARLQLKVGRVAVRSAHQLRASLLRPEGGTGTFYDQAFDVVTPFRGLLYQSESEALYVSADERLVVGLRHTHTRGLDAPAEVLSRLGPLALWRVHEGAGGGARHSAVLLSQWHLSHGSRAGRLVSAWVPYLALGYVLEGSI